MNFQQMALGAAVGALFLGAFFYGKHTNRKVQLMKEELEKLTVIAQNVRDPNELAIVTARASVLSAGLLLEISQQLKSGLTEQRRSNLMDERIQSDAREALTPYFEEVHRLLKKLAGEEAPTVDANLPHEAEQDPSEPPENF